MDYKKLTELDLEAEQRLLNLYKEEIKTLPAENMVCTLKEGRENYYLSVNTRRKYIPATNFKLINDIKRYHFLKKSIENLDRNSILQRKILQRYKSYDFDSINNSLPQVYRLPPVTQHVAPNTTPFATSEFRHRTSIGFYVRSKSEALIAEVLAGEGIYFEYERPLKLWDAGKQVTIRPDFSIPTVSGMIYWEHMGMMSKSEYRGPAVKRFEMYASNGITVPDRLIISMDTEDGAIDVMAIKLLANTVRTLHDL